MAVALNTFRTVTATLSTTFETIYTTPLEVSSIILMAQITNVTSTAGTVTFAHDDGVQATELLKDFAIPGNDAVAAVTGKLVLESGEQVRVSANQNNKFKIVLSILESANE
jgi:hypothetical protein